MAQQDTHRAGYYALHLAEVSREHPVTLTDHVHNTAGEMLIRRGTAFDVGACKRLLSQALAHPLEDRVRIAGGLDETSLNEDILAWVQALPGLEAIHEQLELEYDLFQHCRMAIRFELLAQALTVLKLRLPNQYATAAISAWLGLAMTSRLPLPATDKQATFLACLGHDIGMLHVKPALLAKPGALSADEWKAMQTHTVFSSRMLSLIKELPKSTPRAALEHHERFDGSGYPRGLDGDTLGLVGQVVAIADVIAALTRREGANPGLRSPADILPLLQINEGAFARQAFSAAVTVLRLAPEEAPPVSEEEVSSQVATLLDQQQRLERFHQAAEDTCTVLQQVGTPRARVANKVLGNLTVVVNSSGLLSEPLARWLEHIQRERLPFAHDQLVEIELLMTELDWQFHRFLRLLEQASGEADGQRPDLAPQLSKAFQACCSLIDAEN